MRTVTILYIMLCVCVFVCDTVFSTKDCCLYIKNETFLYDNTFIPKDAVLTEPGCGTGLG